MGWAGLRVEWGEGGGSTLLICSKGWRQARQALRILSNSEVRFSLPNYHLSSVQRLLVRPASVSGHLLAHKWIDHVFISSKL